MASWLADPASILLGALAQQLPAVVGRKNELFAVATTIRTRSPGDRRIDSALGSFLLKTLNGMEVQSHGV